MINTYIYRQPLETNQELIRNIFGNLRYPCWYPAWYLRRSEALATAAISGRNGKHQIVIAALD